MHARRKLDVMFDTAMQFGVALSLFGLAPAQGLNLERIALFGLAAIAAGLGALVLGRRFLTPVPQDERGGPPKH
jgi:hypothetical protein